MLERKRILVVGGSGSFGTSITNQLVDEGYEVCVTCFHKPPTAPQVKSYQVDITDEASVVKMIETVLSEGVLAGIVYAPSAPVKSEKILTKQWSSFQQHLEVQVKGMHTVMVALQDFLKENSIRIVVVLSEYCLGNPPIGLADYVLAKYALQGYSKVLAQELSVYGTTVNMVSPTVAETSLTAQVPRKIFEMMALKNPLRRNAQSSDVAGVVSFLLSDSAAYLNGVNIPINGGAVML
jgi:3-oxoacyl-[acyl-carrier protein] reductase